MKIFKKLSSFGTALIMITSMSPVHAEESDITQINTQERTRTQLNTQIPGSDFGQYQHQYKYMNQYQKKESNSVASFINRMNTTDRYTQGSAATGPMNRQNTASRSITGGRYAVF